jgi:histidinol-phosphate aminotransferase
MSVQQGGGRRIGRAGAAGHEDERTERQEIDRPGSGSAKVFATVPDCSDFGNLLSMLSDARHAHGTRSASALPAALRPLERDHEMSRFWSHLTHGLTPYVPGEQPRMTELVKLNTNENPIGPSPRALEAIRDEATDTLRLYPDPQAHALRTALAAYHKVRPEQVFVGNGSDEVLAHAFAALLKHDAPLLFPDITYSFYPVYCRLFGIAYEAVPLDDGMQIRVADYRRSAGALIVPNPNAPTGIALSRAEIATLLEQHPDAPVVVDEAYVDFGAETAIPLVASHRNLLVVQTMSKSRALAGLRVGYAIGDADLIEALNRVKDSFNSYPLGRPAQAGAIASLEDEAWFQEARARVIASRERLDRGLARLGFDVLPSSANFVFARHPAQAGAALAAALRQRAVIVRHFSAPRIADYLRITVGTDGQTDRLLSALSEILAGKPAAA